MRIDRILCSLVCLFIIVSSCQDIQRYRESTKARQSLVTVDTSKAYAPKDSVVTDSVAVKDTVVTYAGKPIDTHKVKPEQMIDFAKTLIGVPYQYASTDPRVGFDCSGFITYIFNHFGIAVPRSSIDFTDKGREVPMDSIKTGDLILFTGTDSTERHVGHMGLVVDTDSSQVQFIHSTSGRQHGVTITPLNSYYKGRYVKTIRVFGE